MLTIRLLKPLLSENDFQFRISIANCDLGIQFLFHFDFRLKTVNKWEWKFQNTSV